MSSYTLTEHEYNGLTFALDHHILTRTNKNIIHTEIEQLEIEITRKKKTKQV